MSPSDERQPLLGRNDEAMEVYPIIHMVRSDITHFIDTPLTYDALTAPDLTYTLIRPLFEKYAAFQRSGNYSVVFCFLINRVHFQRDYNLATKAVSRTRAELCEILASRILREQGNSLFQLALALTTTFPVYSGADPSLLQLAREERDDLEEHVGNAIEIAIVGKSKRFIKSAPCQRVIQAIWTGKIVYQAQSSHSILSDNYKRNPIHLYDPHSAPLLDHYRLKVPSIRSVLEYTNFLILFVLFIIAIEMNEIDRINAAEGIFMVYALGFTLEKVAAMQEHGIHVYFKGTWNGFDLAFVTTYLVYACLRLYGVLHHHKGGWARALGVDFLALTACLLFPRLAFVTLKNNLMVLSLRAMMMQFLVLMLIAAFCFCGFLYALWTLSRNQAKFTAGTIAWWMLDLWFGLDASGFDKATQFHYIFGPILMVTYACLSNTLLLTILVSILSNTFAKINEDAAAEAMFRRAVSTIEGVKADSLFSYQPPVNLIALCIMLPSSFVLSPRWFHKVNVFLIRLTSFPILLMIALYERQSKKNGTTGFYETISAAAEKLYDTLPRQIKRLTFLEGLAGTDADIDAIFEIEDELNDTAVDEEEDDLGTAIPPPQQEGDNVELGRRTSRSQLGPPATPPRARRPSHRSLNGSQGHGSPPGASDRPRLVPQRTRINSIMHRAEAAAQSFTSPLAQIFTPLVVDEEPLVDVDQGDEQDSTPTQSSPSGHQQAPLVSYGPASRRRLSSMHPIPGAQRRGLLSEQSSKMFPMSESPSSVSQLPGVGQVSLPTAEKVMESEENAGGPQQWLEAIGRIEQRQKRIEQLLEKVLEDPRK